MKIIPFGLMRRGTPSEPPLDVADYYVSEDGTGNGLSSLTPMSIALAETTAQSMTAGEIMAFKGGDEFYGNFTLTNSGSVGNPITFTSYGTGKARLKGNRPIDTWANEGSNIWSKAITDEVSQVFKNGNRVGMPTLPSTGYNNIDSIQNVRSIFTDASLIGEDLLGAVIFVKSASWKLDRRIISAFNSTTGQITVDSNVSYDMTSAYSTYFISNNLSLLTTQDDWYYDYDSNEIFMYSTSEPTGITISDSTSHIFDLTNCNYIDFDNISIINSNRDAIHGLNSSNINITDVILTNNYENGIYFYSGANVTMDNITITGSIHKGIGTYSDDHVITNNTVSDIGLRDDITNKWGTYELADNGTGIVTVGAGSTIQYNTVSNVGLGGIRFDGANSLIDKNFVEGYSLTTSDASGIYTYSNGQAGSVISNNTVIGDDTYIDSFGIYLDDYTTFVTVDNNHISGTNWYGIFSHNTNNCDYTNNTVYNSGVLIKNDAIGGQSEVNTFTGNKVYLDGTTDLPLWIDNTLQTTWANMVTNLDNNIYYAPDGLNSVRVQTTAGNNSYRLADWQTYSNEDANSIEDSLPDWANGGTSQYFYNYTNAIVSQPLTGDWYDLDSVLHQTSIDIPAYGSVILVNKETGVIIPSTTDVFPQDNAASVETEVNSIGSWYSEYGRSTVTVDSVDFVDGAYSVDMVSDAEGTGIGVVMPVPVTSGKIYDVTIWLKLIAGDEAAFQSWEGFSDFTTQYATATTWTEYTWTLTANVTGTAYIRVYPGRGTTLVGDQVKVDKVSVIEN